MSAKKITKEEAERIVKECNSIADFCRKVGWVPMGDNYKTFHRYEKEYGLDTSHFTGVKTNIGNANNKCREKTAAEYAKSRTVKTSTLLKKLFSEGIKERKCECCKNSEWLGEEIPLELHHIDGNHFNNDLSNLMVLCPNCHAKTDSYRGKKNKKQAIKVCKYCGKEVSKWSKSLVCEECSHKHQRKVEWPSKETLEKLLEENSINAISIMYGVSFHTVKKWVKRYNLG